MKKDQFVLINRYLLEQIKREDLTIKESIYSDTKMAFKCDHCGKTTETQVPDTMGLVSHKTPCCRAAMGGYLTFCRG